MAGQNPTSGPWHPLANGSAEEMTSPTNGTQAPTYRLDGARTRPCDDDDLLVNVTETVYGWDAGFYDWLDRMTTIQSHSYVFLSPVIIIAGIGGNLLSLAILRSRYFANVACGSLLSVLALVDSGVLVTGLLRVWIMETFNYDIRIWNVASCRSHYFVTYLLQHTSSWTIVMVTVERFISVYYPFKAKCLFSQRRLRIGLLSILAILVVINGHVLFTLYIVKEVYEDIQGNLTLYRCMFSRHYFYGNVIWPWVDCVVLALLPFAILLTGNALIVVRVVGKLRERQHLTQQHCHQQKQQLQLRRTSRKRKIGSLTLMLFAVTGTFLVTLIPYEVYLIGMGHGTWDIVTIKGSTRTAMANVICELLFYVNNAANFLLYCVSGSRFRMALQEYCRRPFSSMRPLTNTTTRLERQMVALNSKSSWS